MVVGCLMQQFTKGIVILPIFLGILHHSIGITVAMSMVGRLLRAEYHGVHLLLPVLLMKRLYLLVRIIYFLPVLYLYIHRIVVVNRLSSSFLIYQSQLRPIHSAPLVQRYLQTPYRIVFIIFSAGLNRLHPFVVKGSLVD